jgi:hypothetical protein
MSSNGMLYVFVFGHIGEGGGGDIERMKEVCVKMFVVRKGNGKWKVCAPCVVDRMAWEFVVFFWCRHCYDCKKSAVLLLLNIIIIKRKERGSSWYSVHCGWGGGG